MLGLIVIALALVGMAKLGRLMGQRLRDVVGGEGWFGGGSGPATTRPPKS